MYYIIINKTVLFGTTENGKFLPYAFESSKDAHLTVDHQYGVSAFKKFAKLVNLDNPAEYTGGGLDVCIIPRGTYDARKD